MDTLGRAGHRSVAVLRSDAREDHRARRDARGGARASCERALAQTQRLRHRDQSRLSARHSRATTCFAPASSTRASCRRSRIAVRSVEVLEARHADHRAGLSRARSATGTSACRRRARWTRWRSASPIASSAIAMARGARADRDRPDAAVRLRHRDRAHRRAHDGRRSTASPCRTGQPVRVPAGARADARRAFEGAGSAPISPCAAASTCPTYLGSKATFTLGQFGGHAGRALRAGDVLRSAPSIAPSLRAPSCAAAAPAR